MRICVPASPPSPCTALHAILTCPQVHFFDHETRYSLGHQWYSQQWPLPRGKRQVAVDGSATYLQSPQAAMRVAARLHPSTMLLVVLRDPSSRALRRWRELARRADYSRGGSFEAKMLAEGTALSRCFELGLGTNSAPEPDKGVSVLLWERCVASICGSRGCIMGEGVYVPQLAAWQRAASHFRWIVLPAESLQSSPAEALTHIFTSLQLPLPPDFACLASQLSEWASLNNASMASSRLPAAPSAELSRSLLRAFFARYNSPLREQIRQMDAAIMPLWQEAGWLSSKKHAAFSSGQGGLRALQLSASALHASLTARGDAAPESLVVGSPRWLGSGPRPSVFVIGSRESGADSLADFLLAQPGVCGGALRLFDDDLRYVNGLKAVPARFTRRPMVTSSAGRNFSSKKQPFSSRRALGTTCSTLLDSSMYLHSRWAPLRIYDTLQQSREQLRFIIVLRNPAERAMRHWRALQAVATRTLTRHLTKRGVAEVAASKANELNGYLNGTSFLKKIKYETAQLQGCLDAQRINGGHTLGVTNDDWERCVTTACNWHECIVGTGLYAPQLRAWLKYFSPHQFLLLEVNQLQWEPSKVASQIQAFLRLPPLDSIELLRGKDNSSSAAIPDQARRLMERFYSEHNQQTRKLFSELTSSSSSWARADWLLE